MDMCSPAAKLLAQLPSRSATKPHGVSGYRILFLDLCIKSHTESPYSSLLDIHLKSRKSASHSSKGLVEITLSKLAPDKSILDRGT